MKRVTALFIGLCVTAMPVSANAKTETDSANTLIGVVVAVIYVVLKFSWPEIMKLIRSKPERFPIYSTTPVPVDPVVIVPAEQENSTPEIKVKKPLVTGDSIPVTKDMLARFHSVSQVHKHCCTRCDSRNSTENVAFCLNCGEVICWQCFDRYDEMIDPTDGKKHRVCSCSHYLKLWDGWRAQLGKQFPHAFHCLATHGQGKSVVN